MRSSLMASEGEKLNTTASSRSDTLSRPLRCIIKLGGAAITRKHEIEKIDEQNLGSVSLQLTQAMANSDSTQKFIQMDWSRGLGMPTESEVDDLSQNPNLTFDSFIVVHGAGSFGHFQASRSGVHKGGLHLPLVKAGFVATRISVTSLNNDIVKALARVGIPTVGMSPFACGWSTCERNIAHANISPVIEALNTGFVPVLHGDAVIDHLQACTILSGDAVIRHLAESLRPSYVVFLTDVLGVYDRPPIDSNAVLLKEISVDKDGSWKVVKPTLLDVNAQEVEVTVASHDTTGGMETKILEAAMIAKLGIDVYITKAGTDHSLRALKGEIKGAIPDDWQGTAIRSSRWN